MRATNIVQSLVASPDRVKQRLVADPLMNDSLHQHNVPCSIQIRKYFLKFNQILRDHQMILIVELDLFGSSKNLGLLLLNTVPLSK